MFEKLRRVLASLLIIIILFPALAYGQASQQSSGSATDQSTPGALATGAHPLGSFGGSSFDQINLFNGNLSMSFPMAALGGRAGTGAGISLSYNSKIWRVEQRRIGNQLIDDTFYSPQYDHWDKEKPILAPGWNFHVGRMMGRHSSWREGQVTYALTTLTFSAPDGTEYSFRDDITDGQPLTANIIGDNQSRGRRFHTADGTAAIFVSDTDIKDKLQATGPYRPFAVDGVVVLRNGVRFVIFKGKVREQHDSDGNIVRYAYQGSRLTQITDTLGRQINIEYIEETPNPNNEDLFSINITSPGFGNSLRTTNIKFAPLANALVGQGGSYAQAETLKTYVNRDGIPNSGLFPELDPPNSLNEFFNPNIIKEITLPSGHKWKFRYNSYGEVVLVETPNLGAIEYRMEQSNGPIIAGSGSRQEIFRRLSARRVWPKAADRVTNSSPESKTTYSDPSLTEANNIPLPVRQRTFSGENTRIASSRHYYKYSPLDNLASSTGVPPNTGYSPWMEGKEIKTEELTLDTEEPKRVTEYTWEQRAGVSWIPGANRTFLDQPENDPRIKETTVRYLDSGQVFRTAYEYQDDVFINGVGPFGYNNVISESVFDNGTLLRKNVRTFVTDAEYLKYNDDPNNRDIVINPHFVSLVSTESVLAPNSTEETRVEYEYDNYTRYPLVSRTFSIATSHNTNFGTSYVKRGNVTAVTAGLGTSSTDRTTGFSQYDIAGNVVKVVGPKTTQIATTDYDLQHFAFPIASHQTIPEFAQEFKTESTYDVSTGLVTSYKDLNNQIVTYFYQDPDLLDRLTKVVRPTGSGQTLYSYSSPGVYPAWVKVESSLDNSRNLSAISYVDGFLKPIQQTSQDVNNDFVSVETEYDGLSRGVKTINPHRLGVPSATTDGYTKTTYDELGRIFTINTFDANNISTGIVTSTYSGTIITVTDQANKQRRSKVDALGRLTEVLEPTASGALTQSTSYEYDARGNLKQVHQGEQIRTFNYDSLGRLLSSITPETGANGNGTTSYEYDIVSNLTKRTDPRGIVTSYTYDTLNRLLTRSYSDTTPTSTYFYDGNLPASLAPPGFTPQFAMGRTTAVVTATTSREQATGLFHTYDNVGRITQSIQLLDGQYYTTNSQYNLASLPTNHTYPSGRNVTHAYNIAGQLTDVMTNGQPISGQATYTAAGATESHQLGNGLYHQMKYNSRLQPTQITLGSDLTGQAAEDIWKQEYTYGVYQVDQLSNTTTPPTISTDQSQNNGNIGHIRLTPGAGQSPIDQFFAYDELNRLKVAKEFVAPLSAPSNLSVNGTSFSVSISWTDNSDNETGFILERSDDGGSFQLVAQLPPDQTSFQDSVGCGQNTVCFRVKAIRGNVSSDYSNIPCVTSDECPPDGCEECNNTNCNSLIIDCFTFIPEGSNSPCCAIRPIPIVGTGKKGYSPDTTPATNADTNNLNFIAYDKSISILYFADSGNFSLRKVDATGKIATVAGDRNKSILTGLGSTASNSSIGQITALALEPQSSDIYLALSANKLVKIESNTNLLKLVAGNGNKEAKVGLNINEIKLNRVTALSFDSNHYWLATLNEKGQSQLLKVAASGEILLASGISSNTKENTDGISINDANFSHISSLAIDSSTGDLYISDSIQKRVYKLSSSTLQLNNVLGGGKEEIHQGAIAKNIALDDIPTSLLLYKDHLLVSLVSTKRPSGVYRINKEGKLLTFAGGLVPFNKSNEPNGKDRVFYPQSLVKDVQDNLLLVDSFTSQVVLLSPEPRVSKSSAKTSKSNNKPRNSIVNEPNPLVDTSSWLATYSYDRYGNRHTVEGTYPQNLSISTANNRLTDSGYTYDDAGNLKADPSGKYYFYDSENRLIKASFDQAGTNIIAQYFYDASGQRIKKVTQSSTTRFVYNQGGTLLAEYDGEPSPNVNAPTKENIYAPSGLLAVIEANQTYYLTPDHLGSPRVITDSTGVVSSRRDFYPFGEAIEDTNIGGRDSIMGYSPLPDSIRQKFTGYEKDDETGLDFAQDRYYNNVNARFTTTDSFFLRKDMIGDPQRFNLYAYVTNNPMKYTDPDGRILRLAGRIGFLQAEVINVLAGKFSGKVSTDPQTGTVSFNVTQQDIQGDPAAQLLFDLVNSTETFIFLSSSNGKDAANLVNTVTKGQGFKEATIINNIEGNPLNDTGGGYMPSTNGRNGTPQPTGNVFAVIAVNPDAIVQQTGVGKGVDPLSGDGVTQLAGIGQQVSQVAIYIHEAAENLEFSIQKKKGQPLNYNDAHLKAIQVEVQIFKARSLLGGLDGGEVRFTAPRNKNYGK